MEDSPAVSTAPARPRDDVDGTYPSSRVVLFGAIVAFGLVVDLASKSLVFARLGYPHRSSDWTWGTPLLWGRFDIRLTTSFNQGALFGLGQGFTPVFALLSVVAVGFVLWWLFRKGEARSLLLTVALGLVSAGALGNLYDRLWMHGCRTLEGMPLTGVRDFLDCKIPWIVFTSPEGRFAPTLVAQWSWPIFNLADSFLVCGAALLLAQSLFAPRPAEVVVPRGALAEPHAAGA